MQAESGYPACAMTVEPRDAFVDFIPNVLRLGLFNEIDVVQRLWQRLGPLTEKVPSRFRLLPWIAIDRGAELPYLNDARILFTHQMDHACIAMCGVAAERILKDRLRDCLMIKGPDGS